MRKKRSNDTKTSRTQRRESHPAFLRYELNTEKLYQKVDDFEPKTEKQELYFDYLDSKQIVIVTGEAGTGKSLLAVVHALDMLRKKKIDTIYISKPPIEVGASLGFLPRFCWSKVCALC